MLGIGIILVVAGASRAKADWERFRDENQGRDWMEQEFAGIGNIDIEVPFGYIHVGTSTDGKVHFQAMNVNENLRVREGNGELSIHMDGGKNAVQNFSFLLMGLNFDRDEFIIQEYQLLLPEDYRGKMKVDFGGGKLYMDGVRAGEMKISMDAGELTIRDSEAERLDARCNIGETSVEGRFRDISVKGDIGVLDVNVYGTKEDYQGVIRCGIGEIGCYDDDLDVGRTQYAMEGLSSWKWEGGLGVDKRWEGRNTAGKLEVKCDIGEVRVVFRDSLQDAVAEVPDEPQYIDKGTEDLTGVGVSEETGTDAWNRQDETEIETK